MRILFLTSGNDVPSSRFRVLQYLPSLRRMGHECVVAPCLPAKYRGWPWLGNRLSNGPRALFRGWDLFKACLARPDVVVVERELFTGNFVGFERLFRRIAPKMVLDIDDGIFLQHPEKFRLLTEMSDVVIAGNSLIAEKIQPINPRTVVIPTSLDLTRYRMRETTDTQDHKLVIGWTGSAGNYPQLQTVAAPLQMLAQSVDFELRIIAEQEPPPELMNLDGMEIRFQKWQATSEIEDLLQFDLGIMPLPDDEWSRYKCGLKTLQYMACGIPAVASPVGVNAEIISHEQNGLLATSPNEWTSALQRLARDQKFRIQLATAGRATVEERYSVEKNSLLLEQMFGSLAH